MMKKLRYNERDMEIFASSPDRQDHVGILQKKGETNKALKERWFVLKGNMLFYFKTKQDSIPLGFILLELCTYSAVIDQEVEDGIYVEYGLCLEFDSMNRSYVLVAKDREDMNRWLKAMTQSGFNAIQEKISQLQREISVLKQINVHKNPLPLELAAPEGHNSVAGDSEFGVRRPSFLVGEKRIRVQSSNADAKESLFPVYTKKPRLEVMITAFLRKRILDVLAISDDPPYFQVAVYHQEKRLTRNGTEDYSWVETGRTEVTLGKETPNDIGGITLEFIVTFMLLASNEEIVNYKFVIYKPVEMDYQKMKEIWGEARCSSNDLVTWKDQKLSLKIKEAESFNFGTGGNLNLFATENLVENRPSIFADYTKCPETKIPLERLVQYYRTSNTLNEIVQVRESMNESVFNFYIPAAFIRFLSQFEAQLLEGIRQQDPDAWSSEHGVSRKRQISFHLCLISHYRSQLRFIENYKGPGFRASTMKKDQNYQFIPINCHLQEMLAASRSMKGDIASYSIVTFGAPAAHKKGFKKGGAKGLATSMSDHLGNYHDWLRTGIMTPNLKVKEEARSRRANSTSATLTTQKKGGSVYLTTTGSSVSDVKGEPTRAKKEQLEEYVSQFHVYLDQLTEAAYDSSNLTEALHQMALGARESLKRVVGLILEFIAAFSDWGVGEEESPKVLAEVIEASSLPQYLDCFDGLLSISIAMCAERHGTSSDWDDQIDSLNASQEILSTQIDQLQALTAAALDEVILQEEAESAMFVDFRLRLDQILSQAITALVTSFTANLNRKVHDPLYLEQLAEIGFLATFESLLSTLGDELGMLEDMVVAVQMLENVRFRFTPAGNPLKPVEFSGSRESVIVEINYGEHHFAALPQRLREGVLVAVHPVLVTQGINETQTWANTVGESYLQENFNTHFFPTLEKYSQAFIQFMRTKGAINQEAEDQLQRNIQELETAIKQPKKNKNANLLINAEDITRLMKGGRLTSCKSAKDRTSMSCTLEQTVILCNNHFVPNSAQISIRDAMRSQGVRIENVDKNTGSRRYAFNYLQTKTLPRLYRPPKGVSGGSGA